MSVISVAGAGIGGIVAAIKLASQGHKVTVYEKSKRDDCGLEQVDSFDASAMDYAGIEIPPEFSAPGNEITFFTIDDEAEPITIPKSENYKNITVDRKTLFGYLVGLAEDAGVKFSFETPILEPIILGGRVCGIVTDKDRIYCDLVIDACGLNSPLRDSLPDFMQIDKKPEFYDYLYSYRACFDRENGSPEPEHRYKIYVNSDTGFTWIIIENDYVDVLIVDFNEIPYSVVADRLRYVSERNPQMGKNMIKNGKFKKISVREPMSVFVADGYAAVGDSAFMTYAAKGSGIAYAMKAGTILAKTVEADKDGIFNADTLWDYEREFFKTVGYDACRIAVCKNLLPYMTAQEVSEIFKNKLVTSEELESLLTGDYQKTKLPGFIKDKIKLLNDMPEFRSQLLNLLGWLGKFTVLEPSFPSKYTREDIEKWHERYNKFFQSIKRSDSPAQ